MKKKIFAILLALCVLYCLLYPSGMARAAAGGLTLWYRSVLPTLLPFSIFSSIIIHSGLYDTCFFKIHPIFRRLFPVRAPLVYPMAAGFLFGFPLGSKICADLYRAGKITKQEAETVSCICNNFGPAFLCNYMIGSFTEPILPTWAVLTACYAPPLLLGRLKLGKIQSSREYAVQQKMPASRSQINFKIIDDGIMDGFTTMIKLAGYIMLFAMLADIVQMIPIGNPVLKCICIGFMEITNGIHAVSLSDAAPLPKYLLDIGIVNFGGLSGLFQTASMMKSTGMRTTAYARFKLQCSFLGMGLISLFCIIGKHTAFL